MNDSELNRLLDPILSDEKVWAHEPNFSIAKFKLYGQLLQDYDKNEARIVIEELFKRWVPMIVKYHNDRYGSVEPGKIRIVLN